MSVRCCSVNGGESNCLCQLRLNWNDSLNRVSAVRFMGIIVLYLQDQTGYIFFVECICWYPVSKVKNNIPLRFLFAQTFRLLFSYRQCMGRVSYEAGRMPRYICRYENLSIRSGNLRLNSVLHRKLVDGFHPSTSFLCDRIQYVGGESSFIPLLSSCRGNPSSRSSLRSSLANLRSCLSNLRSWSMSRCSCK